MNGEAANCFHHHIVNRDAAGFNSTSKINTHFMLTNEMPHGGLKQSGYGKDMSAYALEDYTVVRHVMLKH